MTNTHRHIPQYRRLTVSARNWRPVLWAQRSNHYTSSCGGFKKGCRLLTLNGGMVTIPGQRHCECCSIRSTERKCEGVKYAFCYLSGLHHHQFTTNCTARHKRRNHSPYTHILKSRINKEKRVLGVSHSFIGGCMAETPLHILARITLLPPFPQWLRSGQSLRMLIERGRHNFKET